MDNPREKGEYPAAVLITDILNVNKMTDILKGSTDRLLKGCTFDLFVKIKPGFKSKFPLGKPVFCFTGNKFTKDDHQQLRNLLSIVKKSLDKYDLMELYDNRYSRAEPQRLVLKIFNGVVEKNLLHRYGNMLERYPLPEWLSV